MFTLSGPPIYIYIWLMTNLSIINNNINTAKEAEFFHLKSNLKIKDQHLNILPIIKSLKVFYNSIIFISIEWTITRIPRSVKHNTDQSLSDILVKTSVSLSSPSVAALVPAGGGRFSKYVVRSLKIKLECFFVRVSTSEKKINCGINSLT